MGLGNLPWPAVASRLREGFKVGCLLAQKADWRLINHKLHLSRLPFSHAGLFCWFSSESSAMSHHNGLYHSVITWQRGCGSSRCPPEVRTPVSYTEQYWRCWHLLAETSFPTHHSSQRRAKAFLSGKAWLGVGVRVGHPLSHRWR